MFGTYREDDVTLLLKDITGQVEPMSTAEREKRIQSGVHYCEMLPIEYEPSADYLRIFHEALQRYAPFTAQAVVNVAEKIWRDKGRRAVLVSLARAGISTGVLIRRYLRKTYGVDVAHYAISIIRGRGIDHNAMQYILDRHAPGDLQFVDGWVGKGAIQRELDAAMLDYPGVSSGLAVLSDPPALSEKTGSYDDFLIASSCLNATVSGLLSRTFLRSDIIGPDDFHGACFYRHLEKEDLTYAFIDAVERCMDGLTPALDGEPLGNGLQEVRDIADHFGVRNINLVKPGIGEATRVLLRRMPWQVLVHSLDDDKYLGHLYQLAREKGVPVVVYPLKAYRACGLVRDLADN